MSDVTMHELELETAELLPARETLNCYRGGGGGHTSITNVVGNTSQVGLVNVSAFERRRQLPQHRSATSCSTCRLARLPAVQCLRGTAQQVRRAAPGFPGRPSSYFRRPW